MADLATYDKQKLEKLFQMSKGYVLDFSDRTMDEFFKNDLGIDIYHEKYNYGSGSKANRMRGFWLNADNKAVGESILKLIEYIENKISENIFSRQDFQEERINAVKKIAIRLLGAKNEVENNTSKATFKDGNINIILHKDIFDHIQGLLNSGHYSNAVEESYKIVRRKLKEITRTERATDAFNSTNYEKIFGHQPINRVEKDFFEGVKFLHMSIQFLRNEKSHKPAEILDRNLALHYIALASLAYKLITRK